MKKPIFLFTNFILATCLSLTGLTLSVNAQAADIGKRFYIGISFVPVSHRDYTASDHAELIAVFDNPALSHYDNENN